MSRSVVARYWPESVASTTRLSAVKAFSIPDSNSEAAAPSRISTGSVLACVSALSSLSVDVVRKDEKLSVLDEAEDFRRTGSAALDLAYVAAGRVDAYFEAGVKSWDIAAGMLLVREAGGRVCDFRGRGDKLLDGGQIVAGNIKIVDTLQKAIVQTGYANAFNA